MTIKELLQRTNDIQPQIISKLISQFGFKQEGLTSNINIMYESIIDCDNKNSPCKFVFNIDFDYPDCYKMSLVNKEDNRIIDNLMEVEFVNVANAELDFDNIEEILSDFDLAICFARIFIECINKNFSSSTKNDVKCTIIPIDFHEIPDSVKQILNAGVEEIFDIYSKEDQPIDENNFMTKYLGNLNFNSDFVGFLSNGIKSCSCNFIETEFEAYRVINPDMPENMIFITLNSKNYGNWFPDDSGLKTRNIDDFIFAGDDYIVIGALDKLKELEKTSLNYNVPFAKALDDLFVINSKNIKNNEVHISYAREQKTNKISNILICFELDI